MPHFLHTVRSAFVTACTGLTTTGARVYTKRHYPWQPAQLPGLVVTTSSAPEVVDMGNPPTLQVDPRIDVEIVVSGTGDLAAMLDLITSEVSVALCSLTSVAGKNVMLMPLAMTAPEFAGESDPPIARRFISFQVSPLFVLANAPDTLV